jgi:hypothetical protein
MPSVGSIYASLVLNTDQANSNAQKFGRDMTGTMTQISSTGMRAFTQFETSAAKSLGKASEETKKLGKAVEETKGKFDILEDSVSVLASSALIGGISNLGKSVVGMAGQFEKYLAVLKVALGTQKGAEQAMRDIEEVAAKTPFAVTELTEAYIKFVNRGIKPTQDELIKFGDIAASQGKSFDQFTEAVLDATSGEFERLREFGILASKNGDQVALEFKGITKNIGMSAEEIKKALLDFGAMDGVAGSMAAVSATLEGRISNLGDAMDALKKIIGNELLPVSKMFISSLSDGISAIAQWRNENPALARTIVQVTAALGAAVVLIAGGNGLIAAMRLFPALASAMGLSLHGMLGPIGLVTAGLAAILLAMNKIQAEREKLAVEMNNQSFEAVKQYGGNNVEFFRNQLAAMERLSAQAERINNKLLLSKTDRSVLAEAAKGTNLSQDQLITSGLVGQDRVNIELVRERIKALRDTIDETNQKQKEADSNKKSSTIPVLKQQKKATDDLNKAIEDTPKEKNPFEGISNQFYSTVDNIGKSWQRMAEQIFDGNMLAAFAHGLEAVKNGVQAIGQQFVALLNAQAQMKNVQLQNNKQNLEFMAAGYGKYIDAELAATQAGIDSELEAIDAKNKEIERLQKESLEERRRQEEEYLNERTAFYDEAFNQDVERLNAEYQTRLDSLLANTSSQQEQAIITDQIENDRLQSIDSLRTQYEEKKKRDVDKNKLENDEKEKKKDKEFLAQQEKIEAQRTQLEERKAATEKAAQDKKDDVRKKSAMLEWIIGRSAFEANKRAQMAQAQIAMAMTIMNAIQGWAMMIATMGPVGLIAGGAMFGLMSGLAVGAGMTTMSAIGAQQYPPPPIFMNSGGMVPGSGNMDTVPAMLTPGEVVIDKSTTSDLRSALSNNKLGNVMEFKGNTINVYTQATNVEDIADKVSYEIFKRVQGRIISV